MKGYTWQCDYDGLCTYGLIGVYGLEEAVNSTP